MKINILTQPLFCNYGGILQNYALQEVLRRMGHEPTTINWSIMKTVPRASWKDYVYSFINTAKKLRGIYDLPFTNPNTLRRKEIELSFNQQEFIGKYIKKVDCNVPFNKNVCSDNHADLWIVGSDQVWRPWCSPYIENCFFDFITDDSIKRISYAASFGTDNWEITEEITQKLKELASKFNAISVREESGVKLCKDYLGVEATHVLDPTMLLSAEDYLSLTSDNDYPAGKYLATYVLDINHAKTKTIRKEAKKRQLSINRIGRMHKNGFDSIETWLATLAHAECVVTDSFHGTVFSIIFKRPVKVLSNGLRGNTRLQSLIDRLNLKKNDDGFYYPSAETQKKLDQEIHNSLQFLNKGITQIGE